MKHLKVYNQLFDKELKELADKTTIPDVKENLISHIGRDWIRDIASVLHKHGITDDNDKEDYIQKMTIHATTGDKKLFTEYDEAKQIPFEHRWGAYLNFLGKRAYDDIAKRRKRNQPIVEEVPIDSPVETYKRKDAKSVEDAHKQWIINKITANPEITITELHTSQNPRFPRLKSDEIRKHIQELNMEGKLDYKEKPFIISERSKTLRALKRVSNKKSNSLLSAKRIVEKYGIANVIKHLKDTEETFVKKIGKEKFLKYLVELNSTKHLQGRELTRYIREYKTKHNL